MKVGEGNATSSSCTRGELPICRHSTSSITSQHPSIRAPSRPAAVRQSICRLAQATDMPGPNLPFTSAPDAAARLAGRAEGGLVQGVQILANGSGRVGGIDPSSVPMLLRSGVLLVGIRLDQAGIHGHALPAGQPFLDAPRDGNLEQVA